MSLDHPARDPARCRSLIRDSMDGHATDAAADALIAADADVDEALVAAAVPVGRDVAAGVAAARRFLPRRGSR